MVCNVAASRLLKNQRMTGVWSAPRMLRKPAVVGSVGKRLIPDRPARWST
jgi:hypothetical protein